MRPFSFLYIVLKRFSKRSNILKVFHLQDLILNVAARGFYDSHIIGLFTHQATRHWRIDRNQILLKVRFVIAHDAIRGFFVGLDVQHGHRGTEDHAAGFRHLRDIDNLRIGEFGFNLLNTAFTKALLFTRSVIFHECRQLVNTNLDLQAEVDELRQMVSAQGERIAELEEVVTTPPPPKAYQRVRRTACPALARTHSLSQSNHIPTSMNHK